MKMDGNEIREMQKKPESVFLASFSYLFGFISGIIVYFIAEADDQFARFNAMQSVLLSGFASIFYGTLSLVGNILFNASKGRGDFIVYAKIIFVINAFEYAFLGLITIIFLFLLYFSIRGKQKRIYCFGKIAERTISWRKSSAILLCGIIVIVSFVFGFFCYYFDLKVKGLI